MPEIVDDHKNLFLIEEGVTYLNCANMSPMLKSVREAGMKALDTRAAPWKLASTDWFTNAENLRSLAATIFQTTDDNIALIPSASYGLAVAAKNFKLQKGKEIIVLDQQFPSNYYVWQNLAVQQELKIITVVKKKDLTLTESILEKINTNTGIITVPNCHWIDGTWVDLQKISDAARQAGSYLVLDITQSLGVLPIDIESINPDFAICAGYKWMLGPYGLGYMYVAKRWQQTGEPLEYSWATRKDSDNFADLTNYTDHYRAGARKFDMGEFPQINLAPMAVAALEQIVKWDVAYLQTEIKKLTAPIIEYKKLKDPTFDQAENAGHIVSIPLSNINVEKLKATLLEKKVFISFRGKSIRVSPHVYNNLDDIDRLLSCF